MAVEAVIWDFGGVLTSSPFERFAHYEAERGLPDGLGCPEQQKVAVFPDAGLRLTVTVMRRRGPAVGMLGGEQARR